MAANFLALPQVQLFTTAGALAAGYKLFCYTAGTTTKTNTYPTLLDAQNSTNANTNPIILNSSGQANVVYSGQVKFVLAPPTDTDPPTSSIWTVDNIGQAVTTDIYDTNHNLLIKFGITAAAVNAVKITNNISGSAPILTTYSGTDLNVGLVISCQGTGNVGIGQAGCTGIALLADQALVDSSANVYLAWNKIASAVNYVALSNAASGNDPGWTSAGASTNIGQWFQAKGTGVYGFNATATAATTQVWYENTSNGNSYLSLSAAASMASNVIFTFPATQDTVGQVLRGDGAGNTSWVTPLAGSSGASVYMSANQTINAGNTNKITFNVKSWDILTNFDAVTNYRFTAPVTGYYGVAVNLSALPVGGGFSLLTLSLYKNGSAHTTVLSGSSAVSIACPATISFPAMQLTANDYLEVFCSATSANLTVTGGATGSKFTIMRVS